MPTPRDRGGPNRIKNRKSDNQPKFMFWLIRNRNDLSKFQLRSIRNQIGKLKIPFRLIRTEILWIARDLAIASDSLWIVSDQN